MPSTRWRVICALAAVALGPVPVAHSEDPEQPAADAELDAELLEFLGSLDTDSQHWIEYLLETDIAEVVEAQRTPAASGTKVDE